MPSSLGSCLTMTVTATPMMKPVTTGLARNSEMKPRRATPAMTRSAPTMRASAALRVMKRIASPPARGVTSANDMMAIVELVVTRRWRLVPKMA